MVKRISRLSAMVLLLALLGAMLAVVPAAETPQAENLALHMAYTITNSVPTEHSYSRYTDENGRAYDVDGGQLTDGAYGGEDLYADAWYRAFRSRSRCVTFDFERTVAVTGIRAGFYHGKGYYAPRYVNLFLSDDGDSWQCVGTAAPDFPLSSEERRYDAQLQVQPYAARYVRVEFCCDIFACCDEIEILGYQTTDGSEQAVVPDSSTEGDYCTELDGDTYGVTDIIKIYNGYYPSAQELAQNTAEELLPYVAYLSEDGEVLDTMFDAVAFVPCVSTNFAYPSGGTLVKTSKYPSAVMSDWIYYTDFLFSDGYELDALDAVVDQVYAKLGLEGKFPVLLTMPYPGSMQVPFGDIDGDGVAERCETAEERIRVIRWYNEYLTERFTDAQFSRLDFIGYYWYEEELNYTWSAEERAFTEGALQTLRDAGKTVLFDAFYLSTGFDHWQELGYSGAVMQPNVAFTDSRPYFETDMLWEFAEAAKQYQLGVEVETNEPSFFRSANALQACINYEKYLYVGAESGYMRALHTFYQGAGPGSLYDFCHADTSSTAGARLRRLYDKTYDFIKERYENLPPTLQLPTDVEAVAGERNILSIQLEDADSLFADLTVDATCSHGRVQLMADKHSLVYIPEEGFEGTDVLELLLSDGMNQVPYTLSVRVTAQKTAEEPSAETSSAESAGTEEPSGSVLPFVIIGVVALLAIVAVAVVAVLKRKK